MAVKTPFADRDFAGILSGYGLGEFIGSMPVSEGAVQTNYIIRTTVTPLVFRYYENRSMNSVRFEAELLTRLKDKGFPCPAPYPDNCGGYIGSHWNKPYVLFEFMQGEHLLNPGRSQQDQLICLAAELNGLTMGYRSEYSKYRLCYDIETCGRLAGENSDRIGTPNSGSKLSWYCSQLDRLELPESLPRCVCHCDFHFTNILFQNGRISALLDFDDANVTYSTFDLAYLIEPFKAAFEWNTWEQFEPDDDILDFSNAGHAVSEYSKKRPLSHDEKWHLFDVFKLSILVDCIWYFERGDVCDFFERRKLDALDRLGREKFMEELFI